MNRLAIRAIPAYTSSHIVHLDSKGKLIDRVNIPGWTSVSISLRDGTIKCTDWRANTIYCYSLTGEEIWTFNNENVLRKPAGIAPYLQMFLIKFSGMVCF
jgi:outer membrane protein assembly factor BamB